MTPQPNIGERCCICGQLLKDTDDVIYSITLRGRTIFAHRDCYEADILHYEKRGHIQ